jgi:hypothetical protein
MGNGMMPSNMAFEKEDILIQQTLHGYDKGHRLIESSCSLPREADKTMVILSDMSGTGIIQGFESYLTGYPVTKAGVYAVALTWYAPEMERPGCVWTHTLLIDNSDLPKISNLKILMNYFVRPKKGESFSSYRSPITVQVKDRDEYRLSIYNYSKNQAASFLAALFQTPVKPIFIPADYSEQYDDLIFSLWSQLWPRLRRSLCFCTGSLSNRKINGKSFDIQIFPRKLFDQFAREVSFGNFINLSHETEISYIPGWAETAVADLLLNDGGSLRKFLWSFGAEAPDGRAAFSNLVEIYTLIEEVNKSDLQLAELTKEVSERFPGVEDAPSLKAAIYGGKSQANIKLLPRIRETEFLQELITTPYYKAFDSTSLGIRIRAQDLWTSNLMEAQALTSSIVNSELNPIGKELLTGFSKVATVDDIPKLASSPLVWRLPQSQQRQVIDALGNCNYIPKSVKEDIVLSMVCEKADFLAEDIVDLFGDDAIDSIINCLDNYKCTNEGIGISWRTALKSKPYSLLRTLNNIQQRNATSIAFAASLLDPNSLEVLNYGTDIWLRLSENELATLEIEILVHTMAFMLSLGFNNPGVNAFELVSRSFQIVHDAAEKDSLKYESWACLKNHVPSISWWRDWDKCERLRRALIDKFILYNWPGNHFLLAVKRKETFQKIIDYCILKNTYKKFIKNLIEQITQGSIYAADFQLDILNSHSDEITSFW